MKYLTSSPKIILEGSLPKSISISRKTLKIAASYFAQAASKRTKNTIWQEVTVLLVDDKSSDAAHIAIMNIPGATDVITQRFDSIPGEAEGLYGELIVNTDFAIKKAPKRGDWSPVKELLLYIAHGMDHLSGADDTEPADYRKMRRRELRWIKAFLASNYL